MAMQVHPRPSDGPRPAPAPAAQPQKRKSFLRRLSSSKGSNSPAKSSNEPIPPLPPLAQTSRMRSVTAPVSSRDVKQMAGPSYEQMSASATTPGPPSNAQRRFQDTDPAKALSRLEIGHDAVVASRPSHPRQSLPISQPRPQPQPQAHVLQQPQDGPAMQQSQVSPIRQRNPIRPALASPPSSPPRLANSSSPYYNPAKVATLAPPVSYGQTPNASGPSYASTAGRSDTTPISSNVQVSPSSQPRPTRSSSRVASASPDSNRPSPFQRPSTNGPSPVSEASAYAFAHRVPSNGPAPNGAQAAAPASPPAPTMERRTSRPLPRPPSSNVIGKSASGADIVLLNSSPKRSPDPHYPSISFERSPTLPALNDPRFAPSPISSDPVSPSKRPSPISPTRSQVYRKAARRPKRLTLAYICAQPRIQGRLLPLLPINSFLSLVGASAGVRKAFTGEAVGRWVLREWGIKLDHERGRSWPNLTVWEGFLEALLHDPATYHTYPAKWHSLLQHLCLSYSLIVLHLRNLPSSVFPSTETPFEEDAPELVTPSDPTSISGLTRMARHERMVELVMPSPLASAPPVEPTVPQTLQRRGSMASMASAASMTFSRRRSNSLIPSSASIKPPPSFPTPKRYNFKNGEPKSRTSSESGRPGSIFSYQSTPSVRPSTHVRGQKNLLRASFASSDPGRLPSPGPTRPTRIEPSFDLPPPFIVGKAPVLRVYVPLSERVPRWPSAEGALWTVRELDKCGATKRLRLGDLVINTALRPRSSEHILVFVPYIKHLLVPLEYTLSVGGHIPSYINSFLLPPSYYYPLLAPTLVHLELAAFASQAMSAMRLAYDRRDVTVSSGARVTAKRFIHVTGFEIPQMEGVAPEWQGIVTLEAEGTAEGKAEMERRLGHGDPARVVRGPWEVVKEKSMMGNTWLRLYTK